MQTDQNGAAEAETQHESGVPALAPGPVVVGIGGSAGALAATMALLESLGDEVPVAVVVVLHLAPDHESNAAEILQRVTPLSVVQVKSRMLLEAGHVYVIAPGMNLITEDGHVQPARGNPKRPSTVIDLFFRSLAKVHCRRAVAIVLSGTGRDGSLGLSHVKECGGLTFAQAPDDCEHDDMPCAAIATGDVDLVLSAADIGKRLIEMGNLSRTEHDAHIDGLDVTRDDSKIESAERAFLDILTALRVRTRHDFRHYKRGTLSRRLERRMQVHGLSGVQAYRDYVRSHPEELAPLLADLLISVTSFFRDPPAFEALQRDVVPEIMKSVASDEEVRVWITACASGEESYSVAILLQEQADQMMQPPRVQIFASDINEAALNVARAGLYPLNISADINDSRLLAHFEKEQDESYRVRSTVRETIVFARHNVLGDPPFSRLDLICCRNLLIYLDREAQAAVLDMFVYALKPGGYLFLGNAESIDSMSKSFQTVDKENRIYRVRPEAAATLHMRIPTQLLNRDALPAAPTAAHPPRTYQATRDQELAGMHERALVAASAPSVLINADYEIVRVSPGAGHYVGFGEGPPTRNLLNNVASDIRVELRAALFRAGETLQPVHSVFQRRDQQGKSTGESPNMVLAIHPVKGLDSDAMHWLVLFDEPADESIRLPHSTGADDNAYQAAMRRLEAENRGLKSNLQETLDRSAISTEELKASNEELQAINEELRSAKEELETSKEELQSVNEELTTVNFELRMKVEEATRNNDDLRNLIEASDIATVFVDSGMRVKRFTPQASKLFALIPSDIGRPLMDVTSRLRYDGIVADAAAVFKQLLPVERSVTSVDGEHFFARILPYRTAQDRIGGAVLTFINVTELRRAEDLARLTEERLRDAIAASKDFAVMSMNVEGAITTWNEGAARIFGYAPAEILGRSIDVLFTADDRAARVPEQERASAMRDGRASDERWHLRKDGTTFFCSGVMAPLHGSGHSGFIKIARDITEMKDRELQQRAQLSNEQRTSAGMKADSELKDRFLAVMSHELKQPLNLIQVNAQLLTRLPETRESSSVQRIGSTIMRAVAAQETIVNDLLDLSRIRTGKLRLQCEATDIVPIVRQLAQAMASDIARKQIEFDVEMPPQVMCQCDPVRIEQIVWNLLGNAVKFTPENGKIRVVVSFDSSMAKVEVADTGLGIAADALPAIFDLFSQGAAAETVGARRGGLGIGLALVRELAQAQGGRVEAASDGPGRGATFTVWVPLATQASVSGPVITSSSPLHQRILMVDDDIDSLMSFAALLELEGASVDTATQASQALTLLAQGNYDLLLSDIGMPEMSGLELIKRVRELDQNKRLRSIAITGYGREADARDALAAGFDAHVSKPISVERLRAILESF
jgi:two-component system, chemotaxis family, CheB/CheR fusion protein